MVNRLLDRHEVVTGYGDVALGQATPCLTWCLAAAARRRPAKPLSSRAELTDNRRTRAPPRESGADLRDSVDAIVVCHVSEITSK